MDPGWQNGLSRSETKKSNNNNSNKSISPWLLLFAAESELLPSLPSHLRISATETELSIEVIPSVAQLPRWVTADR